MIMPIALGAYLVANILSLILFFVVMLVLSVAVVSHPHSIVLLGFRNNVARLQYCEQYHAQ